MSVIRSQSPKREANTPNLTNEQSMLYLAVKEIARVYGTRRFSVVNLYPAGHHDGNRKVQFPQMRTVQATTPGATFHQARRRVPEPEPGQVRVRAHACGVCAGYALARYAAMGVLCPATRLRARSTPLARG